MMTTAGTPSVAVDPTIQMHPDLEQLRLGAELALTLVPLVAGMVDEPRDRAALVVDAVTCWQALPATTRESYQATADGTFSALELFAWDYHTIAEQAATAAMPSPATVPAEADEEEVQRAAWSTVVHGARQRQRTGAPPPGDWLAQFSSR